MIEVSGGGRRSGCLGRASAVRTRSELAEIVQDEQFRTELRDFFRRAFGTERGKLMATPEMLAHAE
jgi:hypothetical protein